MGNILRNMLCPYMEHLLIPRVKRGEKTKKTVEIELKEKQNRRQMKNKEICYSLRN